ncbi:MAG: response regulator [Thermodesulfobacteriota bacterium]|nr:response regulator [Thermodesulfobacteriota bacterium]
MGRAVKNNFNILLAEDDRDIREIVLHFLEIKGYKVKAVPDGMEALKELKRNPYKLLITDIHMPRMDGKSLIKQLRKNRININTLVMSGGLNKNTYKLLEEKNVISYILKPFNLNHLLQQVEKGFIVVN